MKNETRKYSVVSGLGSFTISCDKLIINEFDGSATFFIFAGEENVIVHHIKNYDSIGLAFEPFESPKTYDTEGDLHPKDTVYTSTPPPL